MMSFTDNSQVDWNLIKQRVSPGDCCTLMSTTATSKYKPSHHPCTTKPITLCIGSQRITWIDQRRLVFSRHLLGLCALLRPCRSIPTLLPAFSSDIGPVCNGNMCGGQIANHIDLTTQQDEDCGIHSKERRKTREKNITPPESVADGCDPWLRGKAPQAELVEQQVKGLPS